MSDLEAYVDAAARLVGVALDPDYRPGVVANLARLAELAGSFVDFPLDPAIEPAPVFEP